AFIGVSVWLLWRSGRVRGDLRPFRLAASSGAFAIGATWIALVGLAPGSVALGSYAGVAGSVVASLWSFLASRRPAICVDEMIREAGLQNRRDGLARRRVKAALATSAVLASLYAMYWSIHAAGVQ